MSAGEFLISIIIVFAVISSSCSKLERRNSIGKLLIDTDTGGDDALAIIIAAENERLNNGPKIIGITCVNGNTDVKKVSMNVLKTLKVVDRLDIPVYEGSAHPLILTNTKDYYFGEDGFGDFYYPDPPSIDLIQQKHAVLAMIELVQAYPGEITLVILGPLTNVALAIRLYPSFLDNLDELIIMGGSTEGLGNVIPGVEFNFATDPAANYVVFNSSTSKPVVLVPWETILRTKLPMKFRNSLSKFSNKKVWLIDSAAGPSLQREEEYWACADAVTMAIVVTDKSVVTKSGTYFSEAIYDGLRTAGMIIVDYTNITGNPANTEIIQTINEKVYADLLVRWFGS